MQTFTCNNCVHAGNPHSFGDSEVVECRCAPVTVAGFPIVAAKSWCSPGKHDTALQVPAQSEELVDEGEEAQAPQYDPHDYITQKNADNSVTTLHIPTAVFDCYNRIQTLEQEVEFLVRRT